MKKYDLLIVGAGISGLSSAYHIKADNPDLNICIVDKWSTYAQGNTAKSDAAFRDVFSSETNYKLASSSISFYRDTQKNGFNLGMHFNGYLFLMEESKLNSPTVQNLLKKVDSRIIGKDEISGLGIQTNPDKDAARIMNLKNIDGGFVGKNCGIMEPDLLASYYVKELESMGVEFMFNTRVKRLNLSPRSKLNFPGEPFIWQEKVIESIATDNAEIFADHFLLATDVWTNDLLAPLGIDSFTQPKKVQVFQVQGEGITKMITKNVTGEEEIFPFTILPGPSIDLRPDPKSKTFWISYSEGIGRGFSLEENPVAETDYYSNNLYTVLREYVPAFSDSRIMSSWAGYYSMNNMDGTYVLERNMNLSVVNGSSGSGIMKADAAGRLASALYSGNEFARLYDHSQIRVSDLGISRRKVDQETLVI
ncbi:MAG: FAD-binding oxidoreductase [Candidatus Thermoplasmatota archaeon]|jgi:glycine/D-amino acid oxidase-like deaminating enzyme|nr:FAD-binding oxidoreductase [Candidatus Thermoplasmatota archaeon]